MAQPVKIRENDNVVMRNTIFRAYIITSIVFRFDGCGLTVVK